jgi:hypothetical protein
MYHHTGGEIDKSTWQWRQLGKDLARVNAQIEPIGAELMKIGNPRAVYSTTTTKTAKNRAVDSDKPLVPAGLTPLPSDFWLRAESGEALVGVFEDREKRDVLVFANHNAYEPQSMNLRLVKDVKKIELFDRTTRKWKPLTPKDRVVTFKIPPASPELLRVMR